MIKKIIIAAICIAGFTNCSRVPMTGRKSLNLLPESMMQSMAASQYTTFLTQNKPMQGTSDAQMVDRVSRRIVAAV
jgi:hypothetical protein